MDHMVSRLYRYCRFIYKTVVNVADLDCSTGEGRGILTQQIASKMFVK
jgi:hypothetical protein